VGPVQRVSIVLALGLALVAGCGASKAPASSVVAVKAMPVEQPVPPAPAKADVPLDPLAKALAPAPVFTCRPQALRPTWRRTLTSIADGLGLGKQTRLAVYDVLPAGLANVLRR
jgi:hypothetical protein